MYERNSALGIVTMSNLQMRRSIASLRNCITNRMRSQDSESSERLLSVASVPDHIHTAYALRQLTPADQAWYDAQPPYPRPPPPRQAARAATYTASSPTACGTSTALESPAALLSNIDKPTCDLGSPRHFHIGRSAADHMQVATCHSALPTLIKLLLPLFIGDCSSTRHADDALRLCQVLLLFPFPVLAHH